MKVHKGLYLGAVALVCVLTVTNAFGQWPDDPSVNLPVSMQSGEQTISKVAATSDGGCFVSFYNNASGNYDMYLQRLDSNGNIMWDPNGILISDHPQESWLTDYDMTVDNEDYAIIVFNDIRAGGDWDIYAYRVSPDGDFAWGPDGLTISDNANFEPAPKVITTSDNNIVFGWQESPDAEVSIVHLRKVNHAGADLWDPATVTLTSTYGLSSPNLAPGDDDGAIVQVYYASGPNYYNPQYIYAYKLDSGGGHVWPSGGVPVNTAGGISLWMQCGVASDAAGGAFSFWYDTRNMIHHSYLQHITSDGTPEWTENGVQLSMAANQLQMNPSLVYIHSTEETVIFYLATNPNQTTFGVNAQKLNSLGERQWGADGLTLVPQSGDSRLYITAAHQEDGAMVVYEESPDALNDYVKAIKVDLDGNPVWNPSPVTMSSVLSQKLHMAVDENPNGQVIAAWGDDRNGAADIYLQNINPDGSLGEYATSVEDDDMIIPNTLTLLGNYPNPFNASTMISYSLGEQSDVAIEIYDIAGRKLETLAMKNQPPGIHSFVWDGGGRSSGVYFYRIESNGLSRTSKMTLLK